VADNVKLAMVVPGSGLVKQMAEDEGIADILIEAGFDGRTHLMSPAMAAAAAITGKLADVRKL